MGKRDLINHNLSEPIADRVSEVLMTPLSNVKNQLGMTSLSQRHMIDLAIGEWRHGGFSLQTVSLDEKIKCLCAKATGRL